MRIQPDCALDAVGAIDFAAQGAEPATLLPSSAPCYSCHQSQGAVDTTFTQFYPTAKPIAARAGTFRAG